MPSKVSQSVLAAVLAACALLATSNALAQYGGTTTISGTGGATGSLSSSDFTLYYEKYDSSQGWIQMNQTTDQLYFFNRARCECDQAMNAEFKVVIKPGTTTAQTIQNLAYSNGTSGSGRLYASGSGYDCLQPLSLAGGLASYCTNLWQPGIDRADFPMTNFETAPSKGVESPAIPVAWLYNSVTSACTSNCDTISTCSTTAPSNINIYFWAQMTLNNTPDLDGLTIAARLVGQVAYAPTNVTVEGGNNALIVNWSWPTGETPSADANFFGVQLFCQRGANNQVFKDKTFGQAYMTAATLCPDTAPTVATPGPFSNLDPKYLCSGLIPPTTSSYRITGLQNGIPYGVAVAAVDKFGNISAVTNADVVYGMPIPTVDFYSEYRSDGGTAQGGYCTLDRWHTRPGALALFFVVGLGLVLVLRKRGNRRRPGPPRSGTLVLVLATSALAAGQARAQGIYHDNSFVEDNALEAWNGTPREYAIEARFGLYTPDVDSAFGASTTKPNAFIFGNEKRPMFQMEFDWEIFQEFGTLAVAGAIGYYKENAWACKQIELLADPTTCARSGDNTSLRLIPVAALLVYRMDEGARQWKIPLVPYAKIGLNYTVWTVNDGNGNVPDYIGGGRGQGGTAGWQAAVGMSLLLDFLDPGAARGFDADSGVNHTYAFFELDHIDGSGLGRKNVLHVGDDTWFTGLMFEF